ncbi:unnamed protein product [Trichogramma brassicae]|uniref:DNA 3'-5' helicase n=1 Tax=Trichogramma brassicae TaxID=86971 RepID=A0A6H5IIP9_9HYME|nr:unnamed protein product [Trichogramma brassicae]
MSNVEVDQNNVDENRLIIRRITQTLFGFLPRRDQENLILCELSDFHNIIVRPTGSGKSLIYQIAATLSDGCTLLISPLRSLIRDQLDIMNVAKINCIQWSSGRNALDNKSLRSVNEIILANVKVIITTPESIVRTAGVIPVLEHLCRIEYLKRIVFDEAHCLVTWGYTFRDKYIEAAQIIVQVCRNVPMSFYSATLSSAEIKSIINVAQLDTNSLKIYRVTCGSDSQEKAPPSGVKHYIEST